MTQVRWIIGLTLSAALLAGCGGGSDNDINDGDGGGDVVDGVNRVVIDASSGDSMAYFNLETGSVVDLSEAEAATSTEWHLAVRRYAFQLNSGASGTGTVVGAIGAEQADFYDASDEPVANIFLNATADSELEHLLADYVAPANWQSDATVSTFADDWYLYDYATGNISANDSNGFLVRSSTGDSYARLRVTDIDFPTRSGEGVKSFEIAFDVQSAGSTQFTGTATFAGTIPAEGGELCFDFDSDASVDCAVSDAWDVVLGFVGREFYLRTNSGPSGSGSGGALGPFTWAELSGYTSATTDPVGNGLAALYVADTTGGVFSDYPWYAYNLSNSHQLWPNYRVYLIDVDSNDDSSPVYAVQVTGYYGDDGNSGQPVIRWREITLKEAE